MKNQNMFKKITILFVMLCLSLTVCAQKTACDRYYDDGVKQMKTKTIRSQKAAIISFTKAMDCYDSKAKKKECETQIKKCNDKIKELQKPNSDDGKVDSNPDDRKKPDVTPSKKDKRKVELSLSDVYLKFKAKGGEFKKVKVNCNYSDWKVIEAPSWVKYSRNSEDELIVEAEKFNGKGERTGTVVISCGSEKVSLIIIQKKSFLNL